MVVSDNYKETYCGKREGAIRRHKPGRRQNMVRCISVGYILLLATLAASMVVLPLILPPLPPPPLMLLLFPVGIMAALMFLAFSPTPSEALLNVVDQ